MLKQQLKIKLSLVVATVACGAIGFSWFHRLHLHQELFHSVRTAEVTGIRALLENGADPNVYFVAGSDFGSFWRRLVEIIQRRTLDSRPRSNALIEAIDRNRPDIVRLLLRYGANPNCRGTPHGPVRFLSMPEESALQLANLLVIECNARAHAFSFSFGVPPSPAQLAADEGERNNLKTLRVSAEEIVAMLEAAGARM